MSDFSKLETLGINIFHKPEEIFLEKKIGAGGFGKVMKGVFNSSLDIAMKILKEFDWDSFFRELLLMKLFRHVSIPRLYGIALQRDKQGNAKSVSLVYELIIGETLDNYLHNSNPNELKILLHLIDLANVLVFLHSFRLIHRDLKPSNIMIDQNLNIKLLDFGISKCSKKTNTETMTMGTILYMAPENYRSYNKSNQSVISCQVDVWAFGCIISEILSKYPPWAPAVTEDTVILGLLYAKKEFYIPNNISDTQWRNLITDCTKVDPQKRITIQAAKERLIDILYNKLLYEKTFISIEDESPKIRSILLSKIESAFKEKINILSDDKNKNKNQVAQQEIEKITVVITKQTESTGSYEKKTKMKKQKDLVESKSATQEIGNELEDLERSKNKNNYFFSISKNSQLVEEADYYSGKIVPSETFEIQNDKEDDVKQYQPQSDSQYDNNYDSNFSVTYLND